MHVIGLTGNIASGKSDVCVRLRELGARVISADEVARKVVLPGSEGARRIREVFGPEVFLPDGRLDRAALGGVVFGDGEARKKLNALLHPLIIADVQSTLDAIAREDPGAVVVLEAPLLIEAGMQGMTSEVWLIEADDAVRRKRIMRRDGLSEEQAQARMDSQMPSHKKRPYADHILTNNETKKALLAQVDALWGDTVARLRGNSG
jgi:dephospho-CoA kinase